jgi:uncharacterized Zn-binding protein involved in type VI secretion
MVVPMPPVVNASADVACCHQGKVTLIPTQTQVIVGGAPVMRAGDIAGSPCLCPVPPSPGSKPCTTATLIPTPAANVSARVFVQGQPVVLGNPTLPGITDGVPPCPMLMVRFPGQVVVNVAA